MPGYFADTSVLVAASFEDHQHFAAADTFIRARTQQQPLWICRAAEKSWLRLLTTKAVCRAYKVPVLTNVQAISILADWLSRPEIQLLNADPSGTRELWLEIADLPTASPKVWMDAYLAAFAICANLLLVTCDADFKNFRSHGLDLLLLGK